jgi:hypothetical protein
MEGWRRVLLLLAAAACVGAAPAAKRTPSLAKVNGLLDTARELERKKDYAAAVPVYEAVLAELGDPPPRHLLHVAAKALVHGGNAHLALGHLDRAEAAYAEAVDKHGKNWQDVVRQHTVRARTLLARVAEIKRMIAVPPAPGDQPAALTATVAGVPVAPPDKAAPPPPTEEPLVLITERDADGNEATQGDRGFEVTNLDGDTASLLQRGERRAGKGGRKVLETGRDMTVKRREILPGSCWDYIHAVYNRAGFPERKRTQVAKMPKKGPYLPGDVLQPGDWLYYRNLSYGNIEHSAIFVEWINPRDKVALMLSYPGQSRKEPARYRPYDLSAVYTVTRPLTKL